MVGGTHGKQSCHIHIVIGSSGVYIAHPSDVVLFFQVNVHYKLFVINDILANELAELTCFLINLYCIDSIGGKILQHDGIVALKEVFAVEKKTLHETPIHIYTSVRFQFRSWKLFYECVQHRPFCQLKGVSIIDQRIILVIEFHFRCRNDYLIYLVNLLFTFHCHLWQVDISLPSVKLYIYRKKLRFVAFALGKQDVFAFCLNWNAVAIVFRCILIPGS